MTTESVIILLRDDQDQDEEHVLDQTIEWDDTVDITVNLTTDGDHTTELSAYPNAILRVKNIDNKNAFRYHKIELSAISFNGSKTSFDVTPR